MPDRLVGLEIEERDEVVIAHVTGELDIAEAAQTGDRIGVAVPSARRAALVIDFSDLGFIDSSGIAMLFQLVRHVSARRQELRVVARARRARGARARDRGVRARGAGARRASTQAIAAVDSAVRSSRLALGLDLPAREDRVAPDRGGEQPRVVARHLAAKHRQPAVAPVERGAAHHLALGGGGHVVDRDRDGGDRLLLGRLAPQGRAHAVVHQRVGGGAGEQAGGVDQVRADGHAHHVRALPAHAEELAHAVDAAARHGR